MKVEFTRNSDGKELIKICQKFVRMAKTLCILWRSENNDKYYRAKFFGESRNKNASLTIRSRQRVTVKSYDKIISNVIFRVHTDAIDFELSEKEEGT